MSQSQPDPPEFVTPLAQRSVSRVAASTVSTPGPSTVHIPATPFLKKLGFGTGVSVFLYSRSPSGDKTRCRFVLGLKIFQ